MAKVVEHEYPKDSNAQPTTGENENEAEISRHSEFNKNMPSLGVQILKRVHEDGYSDSAKALGTGECNILCEIRLIYGSSSSVRDDLIPMKANGGNLQHDSEVNSQIQKQKKSSRNKQAEYVVENNYSCHAHTSDSGPHDHGKEGELVKEKNAVDSNVTTLHDAIHIFNKFNVLDSHEHIEVRSAFGYEGKTIEDNSSKSDGEAQTTWKGRRRKLSPTNYFADAFLGQTRNDSQ